MFATLPLETFLHARAVGAIQFPNIPMSCLMPSTMSCDVSATKLPFLRDPQNPTTFEHIRGQDAFQRPAADALLFAA